MHWFHHPHTTRSVLKVQPKPDPGCSEPGAPPVGPAHDGQMVLEFINNAMEVHFIRGFCHGIFPLPRHPGLDRQLLRSAACSRLLPRSPPVQWRPRAGGGAQQRHTEAMAAEDDELLAGVTLETMETAGAPAQE